MRSGGITPVSKPQVDETEDSDSGRSSESHESYSSEEVEEEDDSFQNEMGMGVPWKVLRRGRRGNLIPCLTPCMNGW